MKLSRVLAWIGLVIIAVIIVATAVTGIMGSKYFYGCLFMCIVVPLLMYVFLWIGKVLRLLHHDDTFHKNIQPDEKEKD